jgi:hypothetical protein
MRKTLTAIFALATILVNGMPGHRAEAMTMPAMTLPAMTLPAMSTFGADAQASGLVQQVTVVCSNNGCAPVQTSAIRRHKVLLGKMH